MGIPSRLRSSMLPTRNSIVRRNACLRRITSCCVDWLNERRRADVVSLAQVMRVHRASLEAHGGIDGVRVPARSSRYWRRRTTLGITAVVTCGTSLRPTRFTSRNHRDFLTATSTAISTALTFLELNRVYVTPNQSELHDAMIAIADRRMDKAVLRRQFPAKRES